MDRPEQGKVYLAGPITGKSFVGVTDWRSGAAEYLRDHGITCYSPLRGKGYLAGEITLADHYDEWALSTTKGIVTRDLFDVQRCDLVIVLLKYADRVSIGTIMEIAWAYQLRKPVILVAEPDNIHNHAFLTEACAYRVECLNDALELAIKILCP